VPISISDPIVTATSMSDGRPSYPTMQDLVTSRLRDAILSEEFPPGHRLPPLRALAELCATSTMPVREAVQALASEGLVLLSPQRGARVSPLSFDELEELYMARLGLEGLLARLGAKRSSDTTVHEMHRLTTQMEQAARQHDQASYLRFDREFHRVHYAAASRPRLFQRVELYQSYAARYIRRVRQNPEDHRLTTEYHCGLLESCGERDGRKAERLVRDNLDHVVDYMRTHLDLLTADPDRLQSDRSAELA
jgi:DNA-binding GntR family transcriptional regulator